jgi:hypothetical protein
MMAFMRDQGVLDRRQVIRDGVATQLNYIEENSGGARGVAALWAEFTIDLDATMTDRAQTWGENVAAAARRPNLTGLPTFGSRVGNYIQSFVLRMGQWIIR